mmetsp:Transcript_29315/g.52473  ORF Transcript_29315/g.52473 Transcript_29315/m.52473 type:complete len:260 (-) Transcript_29315:15-794(-)
MDNDSGLMKKIKRKQLSHILHAVVALDTNLSYYQGFNEIATIFFLVGGEDLGFKLSMKVAQNYVRDCMRRSFDDGLVGAMKSIYIIIQHKHPDYHQILMNVMPEIPSPCVGWILAWFTQKLDSFDAICRVFDFILANHALTPIYITATILMELKKEILNSLHDEGSIYDYLNKVLMHVNWDYMIEKSAQLLEEIPPEQVISETPFSFLPDSPYLRPSPYAHNFIVVKKKQTSPGKYFLSGAAAAVAGLMSFRLFRKVKN